MRTLAEREIGNAAVTVGSNYPPDLATEKSAFEPNRKAERAKRPNAVLIHDVANDDIIGAFCSLIKEVITLPVPAKQERIAVLPPVLHITDGDDGAILRNQRLPRRFREHEKRQRQDDQDTDHQHVGPAAQIIIQHTNKGIA